MWFKWVIEKLFVKVVEKIQMTFYMSVLADVTMLYVIIVQYNVENVVNSSVKAVIKIIRKNAGNERNLYFNNLFKRKF